MSHGPMPTAGQSSLSITLKELIDRGYLSDCVFIVGGEDDRSRAIDDSTNESRRNSQRILNAAKTSLLMAKAFAKCTDANILPSVRLEHITVQLLISQPSKHDEDDLVALLDKPVFRDPGEDQHDESEIFTAISNECTLLDMNIVLPDDVNQDLRDGDEETNLRHLGELISKVFSQTRDLPVPPVIESHQITPERIGSASASWCSSRKRANEMNLFSNLVEAGDYPVSVCRLLSDMVDTSIGRRDESSFKSFDDLIDDLHQMSSHPSIFLYDAGSNTNNREFRLLFGKRYYGQKEDISQILAISTNLELPAESLSSDISSVPSQAEVVFVTGVAGQGKTHLVSRVGEFLSSLDNWIVAETKFERGAEHESRQCISSLFDKLLASIVGMKGWSGVARAQYSHRVTKAISEQIDRSSLGLLTTFIPSLRDLVIQTDRDHPINPGPPEVELKSWQLIFLLSKLMSAVLSLDHCVMICLEDMQWCDPVMLALMTEIIVHSGEQRHRCLFVGTYRATEVSEIHPLMAHCEALKANKHVNVTDIQLSSLERSDVLELVMTEMRLPRRLVVELADVVHKKTSGHPLFVIQLLNSLIHDATITYSRRKLCYGYDSNKLASIKTWDSVASLIVSNLSLLSEVDLECLRVLSCFGMQTHASILDLLEGSPGVQAGGMSSSLNRLVNDGIIDRTGSMIAFSHDLIHQQVYQNMTEEHRHHLQFSIATFLGSKTTLDMAADEVPIEGEEQLHLSNNEQDDTLAASLSLIAVDMINDAGPQYTKEYSQQTRFARWNLHAASESKSKSNFQSALHYCKKGIAFLGDDPWSSSSSRLCQDLHECASFASCAVANTVATMQFANAIIENVVFEDSLFARLMILRSLQTSGEHEQIIAHGLDLLRNLKFDIPINPTHPVVLEAMVRTENITSEYSVEQIIRMQNATNIEKQSVKRKTLNIVDAVSTACYRTSSPHFPLVACALVNYSLEQNVICEESAPAFLVFGFFMIFLLGRYDSGRYWGNVAEKILDNSLKPHVGASVMLYGYLSHWFKPLDELSDTLFDTHEIGMKVGEIEYSMVALVQYWRCSFYQGRKLSVLALSYEKYMKVMVKYSYESAKFAVLDIAITTVLMGASNDPYSHFEGSVKNETELFDDSKMNNYNLLLQWIIFKRFLIAFYFGDFNYAAILSEEFSSFPSSKLPTIQLIFHNFYYGLTAFYLFREGKGESYLDQGELMLERMKEWHQHSESTFENKLLLLEAEYFACVSNRGVAIEKYTSSIKAARDNGFLHEKGIAHEFMGHYLASIIEFQEESTECYKQAYVCYLQWGAVAKAKRIQEDHNLNILDGVVNNNLKHERYW